MERWMKLRERSGKAEYFYGLETDFSVFSFGILIEDLLS
jgi:hypothetical protein